MQIQDDAFDLVLFDLDGTLVDTAPDMVGALQEMQRAYGLAPIDYQTGRSNVSNGAMGLIRLGFPEADEIECGDLICDYIERYAERLCDETCLFPGIDELLEQLEENNVLWGVVTNKPEHLTNPLLDLLGVANRIACAVSGDTLAVRKPEPAPLLLGCDIANVEPEQAIYVGDAERDIEAGRRAGMATIAVNYGYITEGDDPREWDPDVIALTTDELTQIVLNAVNLES